MTEKNRVRRCDHYDDFERHCKEKAAYKVRLMSGWYYYCDKHYQPTRLSASVEVVKLVAVEPLIEGEITIEEAQDLPANPVGCGGDS